MKSSAMGGMENSSSSGAVAASPQRMMASSQDFRGAQLFAPPSQPSSDLSPSMMRTLQTAGSGLASSSGDLRALDLSSWMFTSNNFLSQSMSPGGLFGNSLTQNYFQCPLDVPFCARQACSGNWKLMISRIKLWIQAVTMLTHITAILNLVAVLIKICFFTAKCLVLTFINRKYNRES